MTISQELSLYSTLARSVVPLVPLKDGHIGMYACGITVYDEAHIGHARQAIVFDVIRRYLEFQGFTVTYVRNFTDIDDKIIRRANEQGIDPLALSQYYIARTSEDLAALGVRPADIEPKVSDHIPDIIHFIEGLIEKGAAYEARGDVLFDVSAFPDYGKLSNRKLKDCLNSDESPHKRQPQDFVLWKGAKPGEPSWESPWGRGRPGWHIECSAMAQAHLGDSMDIHGGGTDLVFPHHENEIAQSEAMTGKPLSKYWVHNGLVMVDGKKMSKSLGNFLSIREVREGFPADALRHIVLSHKYSSNIDFTTALFVDAMVHVVNAYRLMRDIERRGVADGSPARPDVLDGWSAQRMRQQFCEAMNADFNSVTALAELYGVLAEVRKRLPSGNGPVPSILHDMLREVRRLGAILGMFQEEPTEFLDEVQATGLEILRLSGKGVDEALAQRRAAKAAKDFGTSDRIRKELESSGVTIQDLPSGETSWSLNIRLVAERLVERLGQRPK